MTIFNVIVIATAALALIYALVSAIRNTEAATNDNTQKNTKKDM